MCGRYSQAQEQRLLVPRYGVDELTETKVVPRFNIAPTQNAVVVLEEGKRKLKLMRWGLIPRWAKDASIGQRMINARAESLAEKPSFRGPLRSQRCLVPADGFFEWLPEGGKKVPVRIILKDEPIFSLAGLWDRWKDPEGNAVESFTIVTTEANPILKPIHDRMPVILTREAEQVWLDPAVADADRLLPLLRPFPAEGMDFYRVSSRVNSPKNDDPDCIARSES